MQEAIMIKLKSFKWSYGVVAALALGLSSCYTGGGPTPHEVDHKKHTVVTTTKADGTTHAKASGSTVKQPTTPGPKRSSAPQLPVIH